MKKSHTPRTKPRKDSRLKTLPPAKRKILWDFLQEHGYDEAITFVKKEFGRTTSEPSLSDFFHWYPLTAQLEEAASLTNQLKTELLALPGLNLSDDQLSEAGQVMFEMLAIKQQDSALYQGLRALRLKEKQLLLDRQKFAAASCALFVKWSADEKAREIAGSDMSNTQKIAALRQTYFKDVDELERSGAVKLPE